MNVPDVFVGIVIGWVLMVGAAIVYQSLRGKNARRK